MTEEQRNEYVAEMLNHIMKKCLWQFHSRAWDRVRQNENILNQACEILCDEQIALDTPEQRCYYVDALELARAFRNKFAWLAQLDTQAIRQVMKSLHEELDRQTITGSLNAELTETLY